MKKIALIAALALLFAPALFAQRVNIDLPAGLAERAKESVEVTLDGDLLKLASTFMSRDAHDADAYEVMKNLQGIYVRSFEFDKDGEYDRSILTKLRAQLGPEWKKMVTVQSRTEENVDIFVNSANGKVSGLVIFSAEPRELTVVNLVGPIDIERLSMLNGQFGIPKDTVRPKSK